ncbi:hypothetical protein GT348_06495 [Aristophania vespae]|uniref:Uncharacterized protein n=1 Tax=Aristophania vespae TaxID=2697033 RepID=A0A6P1NC75_9PROT|nr:hypothetical protein [Aristophania vespae]QHI95936.1 hypothetical protein GT348_06495 [Aristophania vespae]UMM63676.1 hypothetical protein DM15PD_06500 [Aristophania vespae]
MNLSRFCSALTLAALMTSGTALAAAQHEGMSGRDCRKAFFAAKRDGSLNGLAYKDFKASKCAIGGASKAETPKTKMNDTKKDAPNQAKDDNTRAETARAPIVNGSIVFPNKIDPKFASLTPGKARMKTCVMQYNANKENGGNGSLKWIQKGGGYWSQCNAHLKEFQGQ